MGVPLKDFMARFSAEERERIEARTQELVAEEMSLRALRKAMGKTQAAMADKLGLKQENVSRVEKRTDMLLSTLDGYLRALGGRLHLVAEFKDRPPVRLSGLADIGPDLEVGPHRAKRTPAAAAKRGVRQSSQARTRGA
jgi:DNA-binding XRE family transcriptional regulator